MLFRNLSFTLFVLLLAHCSAPVSVRPVKPVAPVGAIAESSDMEERLGAIRESYQRIAAGDETAIAVYNYEVARLVQSLKERGVDSWSAPLVLSGIHGIRTLKTTYPSDLNPAEFKFYPADALAFSGDFAISQPTVSGVGAPVVAGKSFTGLGFKAYRKKLPMRNLTAIVRFEGSVATLDLVDPYQVERGTVAGKTFPLAANYGAAVMLALSKSRVDKLGIRRLLWPSRYNDTTHLNFLQPYDPDRIPVLMVHGLDSTPVTFAPLYFKLLEDPEIRARYQFWVFSYPSGYPYPYSATLLRRELDQVKMEFPKSKEIVLIGHSMGTLLSRLMVTDAGEKLWIDAFGKPVSETRIPGASRELLEETLVFENRPEVQRAIFISGPHRGSELATDLIGRLFTRLIRLPGTLADVRDTLVSAATVDAAAINIAASPNSIESLSPTNAFVVAINKVPIAPGVTYHSIMGDRGKGDTPNSSDGVVPYWSSHLDGAASEKIVPSGHGAHQHPEGMEEVRRILIENLN